MPLIDAPAAPHWTLVSAARPARPLPTAEQLSVIGNTARRLRVLAGPGSGKTTTLVETVAERVEHRGVAPEQILVLTYARRAATELSSRIGSRLGVTTRQPIVRTLHSYAYSLVRAHAARAGEPPPRMIAAAESEQVIRDLLAGDAERGGGRWPAFLRSALTVDGFAASLRDVLARATERGLGPKQISALGRRHRREEWSAIGEFARQYAEVLDLRTGTMRQGQALDQAELVGVALGLLRSDEVLAAEQARIRRIFVDEFQDVDPGQLALIESLADASDEVVLFGDPDQSVYAFRGSDPSSLRTADVDKTVVLTRTHRLPELLGSASRRIAALLPGSAAHRELTSAPDASVGSMDVRLLPTVGAEASFVADELRRAHLVDGVPWSQMAVIARSPAAALPALRRAFGVAGVPLGASGAGPALTEDPLVAALVVVMSCAISPAELTGERAIELLTSPIGGFDALGLRRLRRALRFRQTSAGSSADLLAGILAGSPLPDDLPPDLTRGLDRVRRILAIAREGVAAPDAETVLWDLWQATGTAATLQAASTRGGLAGQRADATLDAVLLLFQTAAERAAAVPGAGLADLVEAARNRGLVEVPTSSARERPTGVTVLSAHAAKGLEWDVVAVCGVQEGCWPATVRTDDLLGGQDLLDAAAALPASAVSAAVRSAAQLTDERRLFYVAVTRARRRLLVTAVTDSETQPSRFLAELTGSPDVPLGRPADRRRRGLNAAELVADLRRTVADLSAPDNDRELAAEMLARLAAEGFTGADPGTWWGISDLSTATPAVAPGAPVRLSPSQVEGMLRCELRAVLQRVGGVSRQTTYQVEGIVTHALAHGITLGVSHADLLAELDSWLADAPDLTSWQRDRQRRLIGTMLENAAQWIEAERGVLTVDGAEVQVSATLPAGDGHEPPVVVAGRLDLLARDTEGRPVVVDFKSGAPKSRADAEANPQLATYQLAVDPEGRGTGGAKLVHLKSKLAVREQPPLTADQRAEWTGRVRAAAVALTSSVQQAHAGRHCEMCAVRICCPVQPDGRQVTV